jgi:hypothetical protein
MRYTVVIETPDRPTSHRPEDVQRAVTKAIENCPRMYDPSVFEVRVVEFGEAT